MQILDYFVQNYVMLFELGGLAVLLKLSAHLTERVKKLTRIVVVLLLAESVAFAMERWTQTFAQLSLLRPMLTAVVYSLYPVILVLMMMITVTTQLSRRWMGLLLIPWIVSVPFYFTSQWSQLVCYFTPDNHYAGGLVPWWPYFIFVFYALVFLIRNLLFFRGYSRANRLAAGYIVLGAMLGAVLLLFFGEDRDYSAMFTSAILVYYIFYYTHTAKVDPLTSLQNRQSYYQDLKTDAQKITAAVSVDMNELKYLNDNYGHEAGDRALQSISEILRTGCVRGGTAYRVGGDEFMILCRGVSEAEIRAMIRQMRARLAETPYTCAFGLAMRTPGAPVESVLRDADAKMYEDKAALKQEALADGNAIHFRD